MRIAVLLNSRAIEGEYPITVEDWSDIYRDFFEASLAAYKRQSGGRCSRETLDFRLYDVVGKQEYPEDVSCLDAIVLTGGTDSFVDGIPWVTQMMQFIQTVVKDHSTTTKVIGFCWGHQAIAHAFGGQVVENPCGTEAGITKVVLSEIGRALFRVPSVKMHQIHRRVVARMPDGFQSLGSSAATDVQGMISGDKIVSFQGHPELTKYIMQACLSDASHFGHVDGYDIDGDHDGIKIGAWIIKFIASRSSASSSGGGMTLKHVLIDPPIINSSSPWASDTSQLRDLYECDSTGAVVTRTSMLNGFPEDKTLHAHEFHRVGETTTSFNSYGFSPHPLSYYLETIMTIYSDETTRSPPKPFIVSIGGSTDELKSCIQEIQKRRDFLKHATRGMAICIELNLSCPNIPTHPPPSYDPISLQKIMSEVVVPAAAADPSLVIGLKITPFTYTQQFTQLRDVLKDAANLTDGVSSPVTYIAATNTLGGTLPLSSEGHRRMLPGSGLGGMAGHAIHALSLGTVATLRTCLDAEAATRHIKIIGIGGISDSAGAERMRRSGAAAIGVATALGVYGTSILADILQNT